jgi:hypothetical protein
VTSERTPKSFDCVQNMRQVRDRLSAEIGGMSYDELVRWLRGHRYTDPVLQCLAEKAAQQAAAADRLPAGR